MTDLDTLVQQGQLSKKDAALLKRCAEAMAGTPADRLKEWLSDLYAPGVTNHDTLRAGTYAPSSVREAVLRLCEIVREQDEQIQALTRRVRKLEVDHFES